MSDQRRTGRHARPSFAKAYSFGLVTGAFFLLAWAARSRPAHRNSGRLTAT